jgi:hypothetical protein
MPYLDKQRLKTAFTDILGDEIRRPRLMRLGHPLTGEVKASIEDVDGPGMVYLHQVGGDALGRGETDLDEEDKGSVSAAYLPPGAIPDDYLIYGTQVKVKRINGVLNIVGFDALPASEYLHNIRLGPQRSIVIGQIDYGLLKPTSPLSLYLTISAARYQLNNTVYDVPALQTASMSSYKPVPTNVAVAVMIELDPVALTLHYTASATFDATLSHSAAFGFYPKIVAENRFVLGWVKLIYSTTRISTEEIYHGHELLNKNTGLSMAVIASKIVVDGGTGDVVTSDGEIVYIP